MSSAGIFAARTRMANGARRTLTVHGRRLARFALIGISGVLLNTALLVLLVEAGGLPPVVATAMGTEVAILSNFTLNDRWTFGDAHAPLAWVGRAWRYNLVALGGLLLSVTVLALLTHGLHLHYLVANLFGIGAGFLWNYALNWRFTWARPGVGSKVPGVAQDRGDGGPCRRLGRLVSPLVGEVGRPWT